MGTRTWTIELVKEMMSKMGLQGVEQVTPENFKDFAKKIRKVERSARAGETIITTEPVLTDASGKTYEASRVGNMERKIGFKVYVVEKNIVREQLGFMIFDEAMKSYQSQKSSGKEVILSRFIPGAEKIWDDEKRIFE